MATLAWLGRSSRRRGSAQPPSVVPSPIRDEIWRIAGAALVGVLIVLAPDLALAQRQSGIQLGYDDTIIMINKDVAGERWAISYDPDFGILQGNIFPQDGSTPKFIWCEDTGEGDEQNINFECRDARPCGAAPCGNDGGAWSLLGTYDLPASFLALPGETAGSAGVRARSRPRR